MDADSTQETPLPGSSLPIRAPLTIDSDSEFCLSVNDHMYSRTSSFNSTSSSIDNSSYTDEHISVPEDEKDGFLLYPDEEIVIQRSSVKEYTFTRPFVKYPDENCVEASSGFDKVNIFRAFVRTPCEESSSATKLGVPVAPLTSDGDSDVDSVNGSRWLNSESGPVDGIVQKVDIAPKVRIFSDDEGDDELQVESVCSSDDINGIDELSGLMKGFVSAESIEDEGHEVECLNEVVKLSESDDLSLDLERIDAQIISSSSNENEIEVINVKPSESDESSFYLEKNDAQIVTNSNNEIEIETDDVKLPDSNELSFNSERIDAQIVSDINNEIEIDDIHESEQELMFDSYRDESRKTLNGIEEKPAKMQPIRAKFLSLALRKQLTVEVNGEGGNDNFDSHLTILAIGKTGVGKSATINSIFGQNKALTNAFDPGTTTIHTIIGVVDGIHLKVIDTPGLSCLPSERSYNLKVLKSIKRFTRKHTPDVVLYVDRLDTHTRDANDLQLLRLITSSLGSSIWRNCIIALTHATSNPPDETSERFVFQRCRFIQEQIVKFGGSNMHMTHPLWLVENHTSYKRDNINLDGGWEGLVCLYRTNEDQHDQVSPFEPLSESHDVIKPSLERKKAYFEEYSYREKFLGNKHWSLACRFYC